MWKAVLLLPFLQGLCLARPGEKAVVPVDPGQIGINPPDEV
jgi:hypothetical protein